MANVKEILQRLMGKGTPVAMRDERGFPIRKATVDELELEQYREEARRLRIRKELWDERKRRFTHDWSGKPAIPDSKPSKKMPKEKNIFAKEKKKFLNSRNVFLQ